MYMINEKDELVGKIHELVKEYYDKFHKPPPFIPGLSRVNYGGRVYDEKEMIAAVDSILDFWLTHGQKCVEFENALSKYLGKPPGSACFCNSGSSANLLAISALKYIDKSPLKSGDKILTTACGFPTTIAPIIQNGFVPVLVDINIDTLNPNYSQIFDAIDKYSVKALVLPHTLGNPYDAPAVKGIIDSFDRKIYHIEDNCDAFGATVDSQFTGTFGDLSTLSFYPAHQMTTGEGGAVIINNPKFKKPIFSLRDWGRDCVCDSGQDNKCGKRFSGQFGDLPKGYDHKYVYSTLGYNLKATEMQAAIGLVQLTKLNKFTIDRYVNFLILFNYFSKYSNLFILPNKNETASPSWFGFWVTIRETAQFTRKQIVEFLESKNIQTRMVFAGNVTKHPCFKNIEYCSMDLSNTNYVMNNTFWIGVYPGMTNEKIDYILDSFDEFFRSC